MVNPLARDRVAEPMFLVDNQGNQITSFGPSNNTYTLASNQTLAGNASTTPVTGVQGGSYIWAYQFGGTTPSLVLETLGPDGVTYQAVGSAVTASGQTGVVIGQNATVRLRNTTGNSITGLSSSLT